MPVVINILTAYVSYALSPGSRRDV